MTGLSIFVMDDAAVQEAPGLHCAPEIVCGRANRGSVQNDHFLVPARRVAGLSRVRRLSGSVRSRRQSVCRVPLLQTTVAKQAVGLLGFASRFAMDLGAITINPAMDFGVI